jgi:hypothetical protein
MTDSTTAERLDRIERGLDALFAAEVSEAILEAVDFEAILADQPADDPVDVERLAEALGRPVGRMLARTVISGSGTTGVAKRAIGSEVGGRVASKTLQVAVDTVDLDEATERLMELDEESVPGPDLREFLGPHAEDSDVFALDPSSEPADYGTDGGGDGGSGGGDGSGGDDGEYDPQQYRGTLDETDEADLGGAEESDDPHSVRD